jgi:3-hydroxymyristoyl/3-hydroxydecanoyl-(acyl carrier protein) dehydratase
MAEIEIAIPAGHPALAGHFPGNPIVPAVVILEEVAAALAQVAAGRRLSGFTSVKFLSPLRPGQPFTVTFAERHGDRVRFVCRSLGETVARGEITLAG